MAHNVVILGAGFGGLATANKIRSMADSSKIHITVIDKKDWFMVGFAKLWIICGSRTLANSTADICNITKKDISFIKEEIVGIDLDSKQVKTSTRMVPYDSLVIALGATLAPEKIEGLEQNGMVLYDHNQLDRIRNTLESLSSGKVAISIMGMPYKCPPAPFEASLLINAMLEKLGTRNSVQIDVYSPAPLTLPAAGPAVSKQILDAISAENINFHDSCRITRVEPGKMIFENGSAEFDVLLAVPPHVAPEIIYKAGLAQKDSFIKIDRYCRTIHDDVYAIGDVTALPAGEKLAVPKAGVFAEGQGEIVAQNIISRSNLVQYMGQGGCFLESGRGTASLIQVDMFGGDAPSTTLTKQSAENLESKIQFEKERFAKWL